MSKSDIKSFPVYLPIDKFNKLDELAKKKRIPRTRLVEAEIDKLLAREEKSK
jgi:predicted transcriptional regulator